MKKPLCGTIRKAYFALMQAIIPWSLLRKMVKDQLLTLLVQYVILLTVMIGWMIYHLMA